MKTITIDFSGAEILYPDGNAIGCEGTHNAVSLTAILPERLLSPQINAYTMLFLNGNGEFICSDNLTPDNNRITCSLREQTLRGNELNVQIQAVGTKNGEIRIIDKTSVATLEIERSIDGDEIETQEETENIYAHIAQIREELKNITISAGGDFETLTNKPFEYVYDAFLDDMTQEGLFFADKYAYTENGEHTGWTTGRDTAVFIRNIDYENTIARQPIIGQIISTPHAFLTRMYDKKSGVWSKMSESRYVTDNIPIIPLVSTQNDDGTVTFDLGGMPVSFRDSGRNRRVLETDCDCSFILPEAEGTSAAGYTIYPEKTFLVYAHFTQDVSVDWGTDVLFYDGQVPEITAGYFDIIFTFDPNANKWCIGVIPKGEAQ